MASCERAIDRREFNQATYREAQSVTLWGSVRPFVSLLDNKQLDLEREAVDYYGNEKLESQLKQKRSEQGEEENEKPFLLEYNVTSAHQSSRVREAAYVRLLDSGRLRRWAEDNLLVTKMARKPLFVTRSRSWLEHTAPFEFHYPGRDKRYALEKRLGNVTRELGGQDRTTLQRINQGSALSKDNGEAVEYALYSRWSVVSTEKGRAFSYPPPLAKVLGDVEYDSERDALTRIARSAGVSGKKIGKALRIMSNERLAEEIGKKDNKGKLRKGEKLDELAAYRLSPRPQQVPLPFNSKQFPERYHWDLPKTEFRCPYCCKALELANTYCPHCGQPTTPEERAKALIDWVMMRDFEERGATLKTAFLNALNANFHTGQPETSAM